jgi:hypothetical protein
MKNSIKIALAGMLAMSSLGGTAFAQTAMADDGVSIVYMSTLESNDGDTAEFKRLKAQANDNGQVAEAQAEVTADPQLVAALEEKSIELMNVVDVDTAANGGKIVYVR